MTGLQNTRHKNGKEENIFCSEKDERLFECMCDPQVPEVEGLPCTRRLLCELEAAARTSNNYLPRAPREHEGRNPGDEAAPEEVDPITEIQIEAVRALFM